MEIINLPAERGSWQFFLEPYRPFPPARPGQLDLDAFYPASQRAYRAAKRAAEQLTEAGVPVVFSPEGNYKALLGGLFSAGKNTLLYHPEHGSRFALGCLFAEADLPPSPPLPRVQMPCSSCGACQAVCPTGAISEAGFDPTRCLRALMKEPDLPDDLAERSGNRLYGCDLCQRVCPLNREQTAPPPQELAAFLEIPALIGKSLEGRRVLAPLIPFLGRNYVRPRYFLCRAACAAGNSQDPALLPAVRPLCGHPDPAVRHNAERAVRKLSL